MCGGRCLGGAAEPPRLGRGGVCVWGRARGLAAGGRRRLPAVCGPHPSPVVHCCFRGGGRAPVLRGLGLAAAAWRGTVPSPPGARRAARAAATAGALDYEWSRTGAGPVSASCDSCRRRTVLGGVGSAALLWRKIDATRGPAAGKPRCQVASERPLPLLEASGLPLRLLRCSNWTKSPSLTSVTS